MACMATWEADLPEDVDVEVGTWEAHSNHFNQPDFHQHRMEALQLE